ncbi:hypothetical protein, partial [Nonomuraea sp. NPDC050310]|uniref:hypothetical protein n=1 Tax=Nonomuraea sp. NPDC050310 TaxID=3154935 RepID=UPI0033D154C5
MSAAGGRDIVVVAVRRGGWWITRADQHGLVVHGRSLRELGASAEAALALRAGDGAGPAVCVRVDSADLQAMAKARRGYEAALRRAVQALRSEGSSWADIAQACQVTVGQARAAHGTGTAEQDGAHAAPGR